MGSCSNKSKEKNLSYQLSQSEIPYKHLAADNSKSPKKIRILINFNRELNQNNATTNMPKLLETIRQKGFHIEFAFQENKPNEKFNITITLILDEKTNFIVYSNFGSGSGLETIHGDLIKNINSIAELIFKKFEENYKKNAAVFDKNNQVREMVKSPNSEIKDVEANINQLFKEMRNDVVVGGGRNVNEVARN